MDRESVNRLRFDRRLQRRKEWMDASEHEAYLASLPDVSEKMTTCGEDEGDAEGAASAERPEAGFASPDAPAGAEPAPGLAGDAEGR